MFQHNNRSNEQTRYYHVDSFGREFKSFLYLDDVDEGNGPFTYLRGTHRQRLTRIRKQLARNGGRPRTSFDPDELRPFLGEEAKLVGPAGTLILTDVRGFHRGSPQLSRSRSVLVNYLVPHEGDLQLDK